MITEASYLIERLIQTAAYELGIDPAEMRMRNFIQPDQFPYETATGPTTPPTGWARTRRGPRRWAGRPPP